MWDDKGLLHRMEWKTKHLGLFFKHYKVVGSKDFEQIKKWKNNHVNEYMFGIELIICKMWVRISKGAMSIKIED